MKRIFHPYTAWEDYTHGMWDTVSKSERALLEPKAIEFTGNHALYGEYMLRVIDQWPITCEHNLSDTGQNRQAWIGHAACCLALGCPEDVTRAAWGSLNTTQQDAANAEADKAIAVWEARHAKKD